MLLPLLLMAGVGFAIYAIVRRATRHKGLTGHGAPPAQFDPELALARERDLDRLYHQTIEQLGSDKIEVRIGALYTLERLAWESRKLYPAACGTLEGFIRVGKEKLPDDQPSDKVPEDIHAAQTILGRMINTPSQSRG